MLGGGCRFSILGSCLMMMVMVSVKVKLCSIGCDMKVDSWFWWVVVSSSSMMLVVSVSVSMVLVGVMFVRFVVVVVDSVVFDEVGVMMVLWLCLSSV